MDETHVLVPDVVALVEAPPVDAADISTALLVVEVLSPSTAARDRMVKTGLYLGAGVREVWLVDPRAETIELRTVDGERGFRKAEVAESAAVPGFRLEPGQLFQLQG